MRPDQCLERSSLSNPPKCLQHARNSRARISSSALWKTKESHMYSEFPEKKTSICSNPYGHLPSAWWSPGTNRLQVLWQPRMDGLPAGRAYVSALSVQALSRPYVAKADPPQPAGSVPDHRHGGDD